MRFTCVFFLFSYRDGRDDLTDRIDFIVCLGGDGTLLYASLLFQQSVPPVMAFHLGSLGFLTPFQFDNFQEQVTNVLEGHAALTLRSRLRCIIVRKNQEEPCENSCEKNWLAQRAIGGHDAANGATTQKPATNILVSAHIPCSMGRDVSIPLYFDIDCILCARSRYWMKWSLIVDHHHIYAISIYFSTASILHPFKVMDWSYRRQPEAR